MKYLKGFNEELSNVGKKIELLEVLSLDLLDLGLQVIIHNNKICNNFVDSKWTRFYAASDKITLFISDKNNLILGEPIHKSKEILDFIERLNNYGMKYRSMSGGDEFLYFTFDKWSKMTNTRFI